MSCGGVDDIGVGVVGGVVVVTLAVMPVMVVFGLVLVLVVDMWRC